MTIDDFIASAPQKTFLLQGDENQFDELFATAVVNNPLTNGMAVPRFTTDHAKNLVTFINEGTGTDRYFIVYFSIFSPDAAEILLKSLEEPDLDTTIILMTPHPYLVPGTIRSRTMLIQSHSALSATRDVAPRILSREVVLAQIKDEFASDADDDAATRRAKAIEMLDILEAYVRSTPKKADIIYKAKDMLFAGNLPTKYVLEYAASMVL
ncbi:MAG: hypothetical protein ABIO57_03860 [Candidatus Paceibacterota bacterium]